MILLAASRPPYFGRPPVRSDILRQKFHCALFAILRGRTECRHASAANVTIKARVRIFMPPSRAADAAAASPRQRRRLGRALRLLAGDTRRG